MKITTSLITPLATANQSQGAAPIIVFPIDQQLMSNWCWAASTIGICNFYHDATILDQKRLVAQITGKAICSTALIPFCNDTADLGIALSAVGHLDQSFNQPLNSSQLITSLQQGSKPVGCQIYLPSLGGGHAVVVFNSFNDNQGQVILQVADPSDGSLLIMPYNQLLNNFRNNGGQWIRSYTTK